MISLRFRGHAPDDVRVSGVGDGEGADPEVLSAGGSQLDVVADVVVHAGLGQHSVILDLRLPVMTNMAKFYLIVVAKTEKSATSKNKTCMVLGFFFRATVRIEFFLISSDHH